MLLALAFAAFSSQMKAPVLPPGCSPELQATVLSIEEALQHGNFEKAKERLRLLPKRTIALTWDDSKVPPAFRESYRREGEQAVELWKGRVRSLQFEWKGKGDIRFSFEPVLATRPDTNIPAARVGFASEDPNAPRLDFVIGLERGTPLKKSEEIDIYNDVVYGIGSYLGLADDIAPAAAMSTTDLPRPYRTSLAPGQPHSVDAIFEVERKLQEAVAAKSTMIAGKAGLFIDPTVMDGVPVVQGDRVEFDIQISNKGDGVLNYSLNPDCGCTIVSGPGTVEPGASRVVAVAVDTRMFTMDMTKHVTVYSNDPVEPVRQVTLNVKIKPRYRILAPMGDRIDVPLTGAKVPIYLIPAPGTDLDPLSTSFSGINASVKYERWEGVLADPQANEGPKPRKGWKFLVDVKGDIGPGLNPGTLQIYTENPDFPNIIYSFNVQRGIIAMPRELFMGSLARVPKTMQIDLSRPGTPFKILSITTNSPAFKATATPVDKSPVGSAAYKVVVEYDGNGKPGDLIAALFVKTDDPKQPLINVPIRATIQ